MRKLLLTSSGSFVTSYNWEEQFPGGLVGRKIAYITTASKKVDDLNYVIRRRAAMKELGWDYDELDIAGKSPAQLKRLLAGYEVIWMEGGNAFYLLKVIRESGFQEVLEELLDQRVIYVGSSAGTYVACPSIVMATWSKRGFDRCGIENYEAMNLVPFLIKAHYTEERKEFLQNEAKNLDYPLWALSDDQALWVEGERVELLGGGEEVIF